MKITHLLLVILIALLAGFGGAKLAWDIEHIQVTSVATKETAYERVVRTGVLRCGYALSPPVMVKDPNTGQVSGLDVDVWNAIGKILDVKVEWTEETGWGSFIEGLKTNRFDAFCTELWANPGRTKNLTLTHSVAYSLLNMYVRSDDDRFPNVESLNTPNVTLPVIEGDVSVDMVKSRFPNARMLTLPTDATVADLYLSVVSKKSDAIYLEPPMLPMLTANNDEKLKIVTSSIPAYTFGNYYGFKAGELELRDLVNIALQSMIDSGEIKAMSEKYGDYKVTSKSYE